MIIDNIHFVLLIENLVSPSWLSTEFILSTVLKLHQTSGCNLTCLTVQEHGNKREI